MGDADYFKKRAQQEREASMKAAHAKARKAHREMAERYDELASALAASDIFLCPDRIPA